MICPADEMKRAIFVPFLALQLASWMAALTYGQFEALDIDHPAIGYEETAPTGAVEQLNRRLQDGRLRLPFEGPAGYLKPLLAALDIPEESQLAVYSRTSLQGMRINPANPRVIFFNDATAVAWVPGGFIEVATHDPRLGAVFYTLQQAPMPMPQLVRETQCLSCHLTTAAAGVPGFIVRSIPTAADGATIPWLGNATPDHRTGLQERWGGWYVTARIAPGPHLGNAVIANPNTRDLPPWSPSRNLTTLAGRIDANTYLTPYSDIVAHLVFEHQARAMNLLTRIGWHARMQAQEDNQESAEAMATDASELVDYFLFIDEAPIGGVEGSSGFAARFSSQGPRDRQGRSLRDFDLETRLMRYPLSYMIYSEVFDSLPGAAREAIYQRLWLVLSGEDRSPRYRRLSGQDRQAIREILRDTKADLPRHFTS
jgi:hypothetical protein